MEQQLVLLQVPTPYQSSSNVFSHVNYRHRDENNHLTGAAKWDMNHPFHLAMIDSLGILQTYILETIGGEPKAYLYPCGSFQLHLDVGPLGVHNEYETLDKKKNNNIKKGDDGIARLCLEDDRKWHGETRRAKPIEQAWGSFEFVPEHPDEIIFFQCGSKRVLYSKLPQGSPQRLQIRQKIGARNTPRVDLYKGKVYCVGRHSSTILSIAIRGDGLALVSAARDGYLRIWNINDGSMLAQILFSQWRQPHNPQQGNSKTSFFSSNEVEVEIDQMYHEISSTMQVVSFLGNSSNLCMGCPNGEVRIWSMKECEGKHLTIADVGNLVVGKDEFISSLTLHVPDCNFPTQHNEGDCQKGSIGQDMNTNEFIAIGTTNQNLQVWSKSTSLDEWIPVWNTKVSLEGATIVSLSFRVDGKLLAMAVSRFGKPMATIEPFQNQSKLSSSDQKQLGDRLYLYNTSSWICMGWLSFTSHLSSCLFYHPHFKVEDRNEPRSHVSHGKVWSCRLLLVSTSSGPQTHILPEYGLFSGIQDECEYNQMSHLNCRKEAKNVHWVDFKQQSLWQESSNAQELLEVEGEGDGGRFCDTTSKPIESNFSTKPSLCSLAMDIDTNEKSPITSKRCYMQELAYEQIGLQSLRKPISKDSKYYQNGYKKTRSKVHPRKSVFKKAAPKVQGLEANLVPLGHIITKRLKSKRQSPSNFERNNGQHFKQNSFTLNSKRRQEITSSAKDLSPSNRAATSLHTSVREENFQGDNALNPANIAKVEKAYSKMTMGAKKLNNHESETPTILLCEGEDVANPKTRKVVTFFAPKSPTIIPRHTKGKNPKLEATISHSKRVGEKSHLCILQERKSCYANKENKKSHVQDKAPIQHTTQKEQSCDLSSTQSYHSIGGKQLHELLAMNDGTSTFRDMVYMGGTFRERSPSSKSLTRAMMDPSKASEDKLLPEFNHPVAFSTTNLMEQLQDIEHETFDLDAAFQVAKAKGIVLSKEDKAEIKAALEGRRDNFSKKELDFEGQKSSARYIPLLKIPDPRVTCNGPLVAPRKVRKKSELKGEDMHTVQPTLFDLWDLEERCPQVSSTNSEQESNFNVTSRRRALESLNETNKSSVWVQREDVCRAASTAQAVYDSCLYRPNIEPPCHCYENL